MRFSIFICLSLIFIAGCDTGPSIPSGTMTIDVECKSMVCDGRPALKMIFSFSTGDVHEIQVCCKYYEEFEDALKDAKKKACVDGDFSDGSVTIGGVQISPYESTTDGTKGVRLTRGSNDVLVPCEDFDELQKKLEEVFMTCCLF